MTQLVDNNLLIYATDRSNQRHAAARAWLEGELAVGAELAFAWSTLLGFIRITTNPRIMPKHLAVPEAIRHVTAWLSQANTRLISPGAGHWSHLQRMLLAAPHGGNWTTDAHLAALALEHDCELCTADGDFTCFPGLKWHNPLSGMRSVAAS